MKDDLIKLIQESELSVEEKNDWQSMIDQLPFKVVTEMYEFLSQYPQEITWFNDFYKRKKEAFEVLQKDETKGQSLLSQIYVDEADKLINLVS
jgi:hypothetical protein